MHARKQVRVLLDEGQRQTSTTGSETGDPFPLLFTAYGRARVDLCELEVKHALEHDAVRGPYFEKVVSTVPHDLFHGGVCEKVEYEAKPGEGTGGCKCEDVEYEDVLGVGGADAHEGESAIRCTEILALTVDDEEGGPGEDASGICEGGYVCAICVSCGHDSETRGLCSRRVTSPIPQHCHPFLIRDPPPYTRSTLGEHAGNRYKNYLVNKRINLAEMCRKKMEPMKASDKMRTT